MPCQRSGLHCSARFLAEAWDWQGGAVEIWVRHWHVDSPDCASRVGLSVLGRKGVGIFIVSCCFFEVWYWLIISRVCVSWLKQQQCAYVLMDRCLSVRACFGFWMMFRYCSGAFRGVRVRLGRVAVGWILGGWRLYEFMKHWLIFIKPDSSGYRPLRA